MDSVVRGTVIYFLVLVILRATGRRSAGEMKTFDLVLLLIVAETTQQALLGDDFSITNALVLLVTLFSIDILLSFTKRWFPVFEELIDGRPTVIIRDGHLDERAMRRARIDREDLLVAARQAGAPNLTTVRHAVLEINGKISIVKRD